MSNSESEKTPANEVSGVSSPPKVIVVPTVVAPVVVPVVVPVPVPVPVSGGAEEKTEPECGGAIFGEVPEPGIPAQSENVHSRALSPFTLFWRKIGGVGFVVSVLFHFALIIFALFYVFSVREKMPEPSVFVSGSGGSRATRGETLSKKSFRKPADVRSPKIFSKKAKASMVLPEMPRVRESQNFRFSRAFGGVGGNADTGSDENGVKGSGGGIGLGTGIGIGDGKNHLGKFKTLLGAQIKAQKIAVYLDCSGSMKSFLPAVKAEIYEKFPTADVFAFSGAKTEIHDAEIVGGRAMKAKTLAGNKQKRAEDETETNKLSGNARVIYGKFSAHFAAGTLGAWIDVFLRERYDALVVFSDFRDGIRQRRAGKTVYADSSYAPEKDGRTVRERNWEKEWRSGFSRKNAPKLYLFSVRSRPQAFFEECVNLSGGEITILNLKMRKSRKKENSH